MKANENGMIAGYFSTYDIEPDSYGDIVEKGAFTKTIAKRAESGHPFPLCFNHDFSAVIGSVKTIEDTEKGPYIEAEFLDTQLAQDVRKMLQSGAIYQFSFAYDVLNSRKPTEDESAKGITNVLTELDVFEISVVTVPANQNAVATEVKAGRRNRKADELIIRECIKSLESLLDDGADDTENEEVKSEEIEPEVNEASEEPTESENSKKAAELLEKIKIIKGDCEQ
jgi:HK97 family phage prohead protease